MPLQRAKLSNIQFISTTASPVYTNPSNTKTYIRGIIIFNSNTISETVRLWNVPASGGLVGIASTGNQFMNTVLQSSQTLFVEIPYVVTLTDDKDSIQASTTNSSRVTIQILGDKE
jgi:hypothetical protein